MSEVGVVGLGVMGLTVADRLIVAGHAVRGFDVDTARTARLSELGGLGVESIEAVVADADFVVLALPDEDALEASVARIAAHGTPELPRIDIGTFSLEAARSAHQKLASVGIDLIDASVSVTGLQAADGTLVVTASGATRASQEGLGDRDPAVLFDLLRESGRKDSGRMATRPDTGRSSESG